MVGVFHSSFARQPSSYTSSYPIRARCSLAGHPGTMEARGHEGHRDPRWIRRHARRLRASLGRGCRSQGDYGHPAIDRAGTSPSSSWGRTRSRSASVRCAQHGALRPPRPAGAELLPVMPLRAAPYAMGCVAKTVVVGVDDPAGRHRRVSDIEIPKIFQVDPLPRDGSRPVHVLQHAREPRRRTAAGRTGHRRGHGGDRHSPTRCDLSVDDQRLRFPVGGSTWPPATSPGLCDKGECCYSDQMSRCHLANSQTAGAATATRPTAIPPLNHMTCNQSIQPRQSRRCGAARDCRVPAHLPEHRNYLWRYGASVRWRTC